MFWILTILGFHWLSSDVVYCGETTRRLCGESVRCARWGDGLSRALLLFQDQGIRFPRLPCFDGRQGF